jgi:metal-responsive CopG/Arc/MetJ family transcriptional regulator
MPSEANTKPADGRKHPKKVLIALQPAMLDEIDDIAVAEHRTRSDLIREAIRRYIYEFERRQRENARIEVKALS